VLSRKFLEICLFMFCIFGLSFSVSAGTWNIDHSKAQGGKFIIQDLSTGECFYNKFSFTQTGTIIKNIDSSHDGHMIWLSLIRMFMVFIVMNVKFRL
jgi:hypothetical protein